MQEQTALEGFRQLAFGDIRDAVKLLRRAEYPSAAENESFRGVGDPQAEGRRDGDPVFRPARGAAALPQASWKVRTAARTGCCWAIEAGRRRSGKRMERAVRSREGDAVFRKADARALLVGRKSPHREKTAVICDGAVRSGKTMCMAAFVFPVGDVAFFSGVSFAVCGKTIRSVRRNVLVELLPLLRSMGFAARARYSGKPRDAALSRAGKTAFYLFGGRDESSAALIQGMTLGGILFDRWR